MAQKKESFFWTSYSDFMTSLFFVMLSLFVLVIVVLHKRSEATERQLAEIIKIETSTNDLDTTYFEYRADYKKFVLRTQVQFPVSESDLSDVVNTNPSLGEELRLAGQKVCDFLKEHEENQYLVIVEGQASRDSYIYNYQLSYERALALIRFWIDDMHIKFGDNCEILISGSGDGKLETHSMRETGDETLNQRFLVHIIPKNILDENE